MTPQSATGHQPSLLDRHDVLLLDLDGVVYTGPYAVPGAVPALLAARQRGIRLVCVTNNASRTPAAVADQLTGLGLPMPPHDVVTSAEVAADYLADRLPSEARVLVVGGEGLVEAVRGRGLVPVDRADDHPLAVVQGFGPDVGWRQLAEAAYALADGAAWVATNGDVTFPSERGLAPGNGALVAALEATTGRHPVTLGKPEPGLFAGAVRRVGARRPLVVGDRLDTDISGARRAGIPALLVLTGVTGTADLLAADRSRRPDVVAADLSALATPVDAPRRDDSTARWRCGGWTARVVDDELVLDGKGDLGAGAWCAAVATWEAADAGRPPVTDTAAALLEAARPGRR